MRAQEPEGLLSSHAASSPLPDGRHQRQKREQFTMDTETLNKAIARRWFISFWGESCDLAIVDELAAPDVLLQYSMQNPRRGRLSVKSFMADFRGAFPDLQFRRVGALIADRDIVVVRWEGSGTHTGPAFEDFNVVLSVIAPLRLIE
jgi:SnoaL-like polyketide cyclase